MIFQKNKKTLLFFDENKVKVIRYVWEGNAYLVESQKIVDTTNEEQNIELSNEKLKNVYVFIPEEQSYLKLLSFKTIQKISKLEIARELENFIPEKAEEKNIYWEKVGENEGETILSVRVIKNEYMEQVREYLKKTKIQINNIFFESDLVAENRVESETPEIVLIKREEKVLIVVINKGKVWQAILVEKGKESEVIDHIKIDFENRWKMKLGEVVEEKGNVLEMIQFKDKKADSYSRTASFLLVIMMVISVVVLAIFVPMILKNIELTQKNLNIIQNINKK